MGEGPGSAALLLDFGESGPAAPREVGRVRGAAVSSVGRRLTAEYSSGCSSSMPVGYGSRDGVQPWNTGNESVKNKTKKNRTDREIKDERPSFVCVHCDAHFHFVEQVTVDRVNVR